MFAIFYSLKREIKIFQNFHPLKCGQKKSAKSQIFIILLSQTLAELREEEKNNKAQVWQEQTHAVKR